MERSSRTQVINFVSPSRISVLSIGFVETSSRLSSARSCGWFRLVLVLVLLVFIHPCGVCIHFFRILRFCARFVVLIVLIRVLIT
jgi:hypothetical protein